MAALSSQKTNYGTFFLIGYFGCIVFGFHATHFRAVVEIPGNETQLLEFLLPTQE